MEATPATPRPAATILLLREGAHAALEVLMVKRSDEASFMPGVWVFPGGIVEPGEEPAACAARELVEEAGIELGPDAELVAWARWITPEVVPVRFDTHFYVAASTDDTPPRADGLEVSDAGWFAPRAALDAHAAGELALVFPTIRTLEALLEHAGAEEVLAAARGREIEPILPRVVGTREDHQVVLPGERGYDQAVTSTDELSS